jgi:hypothetical protein
MISVSKFAPKKALHTIYVIGEFIMNNNVISHYANVRVIFL